MKKSTTRTDCKHNVWKAFVMLLAVLLLSAVFALTVFAEDIDVNDVVEITSAKYTGELVDGFTNSGISVLEDGKFVSKPKYEIEYASVIITLKMADGSIKQYSGQELVQLLGSSNVKITTDQSAKNIWEAGTHAGTVKIGSLQKEFSVIIQPNPATKLAEIVSVEYTGELIDRKSSRQQTGKNAQGETVSYNYYNINTWDMTFVLRFNDEKAKEYNGSEVSAMFGNYFFNIKTDQSPDNPWGAGAHNCTVSIGTLEKNFEVTIEPNPDPELTEIISAEYTRTLLKGIDSTQQNIYKYGECDIYSIDPGAFRFVFRFSDNAVKEFSYSEAQELFGSGNVNINNTQYDSPWQIGKNTCSITVCGLTKDVEVTVDQIVEIVSAEYGNTIIEGKDGFVSGYINDKGELTKYIHYTIHEDDIRLVLRFVNGGTEECTLGELKINRDFDGKKKIVFSENQSKEHPWKAGAHTCKLTIGSLEKEFEIIVDPSPVDHIAVVQKYPIIKDVGTEKIAYYLSVIAYYNDGTEKELKTDYIEEAMGLNTSPSSVQELQLGHNTITVSFLSFSAQVDVELIENPYKAISVSEEEPFCLLLTRKDDTQEKIDLNSYDFSTGLIQYNEEDGTFSIGKIKSNPIQNLSWMEARDTIFYDYVYTLLYRHAPIDYTRGNITEDNIRELLAIAIYAREKTEKPERNRNGEYAVKDIQTKFSIVFGEENFDFSGFSCYDPATKTIHWELWTDKFGDIGGEKWSLHFENGQYVFKTYVLDDDRLAYQEEPYLVVTYDTALHITGIYFHDIDIPAVKPGDVDGDGEVTSGDARLALRASVKLEDYQEGSAAFLAADADHNGVIESGDARLILRASVKLETLTPAAA